MNVKFGLFDREDASAVSEGPDGDGDHLRYADADIARSDDDALLEIAKGDLGA